MTELGKPGVAQPSPAEIMLADFEVIRKVGTGANAFAYLAKCRPGGRLDDHTDTLVVLKVLLHYKQPGGAELGATSSSLDRTFIKDVAKEVKGPNFEEVRPNFVHILGYFTDDALALPEYLALDPEGDFVDPNTAFIVMPYFSGGDLQTRLEKCQAEGDLREPLAEKEIIDYLMQILDAVRKLVSVKDAHRDLKPDNIFFTPARDGAALADFGELGPVQLEFTKGVTSPGGAPGNFAPEVTAAIEGLADGATATIDYSKNDVFAVGIVAYKMVCGDKDAEPWADGVPRTAETMMRLPEGRCSPGLRTLIEDGLLNPVFVSTQAICCHAAVLCFLEVF
jgi:serine/threonine protein kinase